jgi:hypothetical protein
MFPLKPYTPAGFEPGSSRSWGGCDVHCATPPGRHFSFWYDFNSWSLLVAKVYSTGSFFCCKIKTYQRFLRSCVLDSSLKNEKIKKWIRSLTWWLFSSGFRFWSKNFVLGRVARWYIFKPKTPIWVNVWWVLQWEMLVYFTDLWYIVRPIGIFYAYLYSLWSFGIWFPILICCTKKNLATLVLRRGPETDLCLKTEEHSYIHTSTNVHKTWEILQWDTCTRITF